MLGSTTMKAAWILSISTLITSLIFPKNIFAQVVINEFVPNADEEWVEFYNASDSAEYLKEYWIDDKPDGGQAKKQLTTLNIENPKFPHFILGGSYLNNNGDKIILYDKNNSIVDQYEFSSVPAGGLSIGRHPDQTGSFAFLQSATKGAANSQPKVDPTPTPTLNVTPSPTPSPTVTPTPTVKPSSTPKPTPKRTPSPTPEVLGETNDTTSPPPLKLEPSPTPAEVELESSSATPLLAITFIVGGLAMLVFAIISSVKKLPRTAD